MTTSETVGRKKILVVDDEPQACELASRVLSIKYDVTTAGSAEAALNLISSTAFDAALVDYHMPGKNGSAVADVLMAKMNYDRIILVTADAKMKTAGDVISYLAKPYDPRALLRMLDHLLAPEPTLSDVNSKGLSAF